VESQEAVPMKKIFTIRDEGAYFQLRGQGDEEGRRNKAIFSAYSSLRPLLFAFLPLHP
jgi:hypothetical protein